MLPHTDLQPQVSVMAEALPQHLCVQSDTTFCCAGPTKLMSADAAAATA